MAAPTFVNAGTGVVEAGGPASTVTSGTGSTGDLLILHILADGTTHNPSLASHSGVEDLAGTDNALTAAFTSVDVGGLPSAFQFIYVGRALGTGAASVSLSTAGDDMYAIWYRFNAASTGTTLASVFENGAGTSSNAAGDGTSISDVGVTTNGADRLACQFIAHNDDVALVAFTGETGGNWTIAAQYGSATGTDGQIGLQTATIATAGTINGGTYTAAATVAWGIVGLAILPATVEDTAPAENAAATGAANQPRATITSSAGHASATGAANDADAGVGPLAGNVAATATAYGPTSIITAGIGHASATGAALDADGGVGPLAGNTAATGAAYDATNAVGQGAGNAAATGAANQPSATITVPAGHAAATGAANDATVDTATATNALAENAAATGAANNPIPAIGSGAGNAAATSTANAPTATLAAGIGTVAATGAANQASAALAANAEAAAAIAAAYNPSIALTVNALLASGTGQAFDATVETSGSTNAPAGNVSATGAAYDATVSAVVPSTTPSGGASWFRMPPPQPILAPSAEAHAGVAVATAWAFRPATEWDDDEAAIALLLEP